MSDSARIRERLGAKSPQQQAELEALVRQIVAAVAQGADVQALETEVNERVFRLFG